MVTRDFGWTDMGLSCVASMITWPGPVEPDDDYHYNRTKTSRTLSGFCRSHMSLPVSKRVQRVKPSPTVALTGRVAQLKAEGKDIIGLGVGEPDFDTPTHIADAGVEAIR